MNTGDSTENYTWQGKQLEIYRHGYSRDYLYVKATWVAISVGKWYMVLKRRKNTQLNTRIKINMHIFWGFRQDLDEQLFMCLGRQRANCQEI